MCVISSWDWVGQPIEILIVEHNCEPGYATDCKILTLRTGVNIPDACNLINIA